MIIGNRDTFIGIKKSSIISKISFFNFEIQENFILKTYQVLSFNFIQTGQDP
jgi:hypothetical protein